MIFVVAGILILLLIAFLYSFLKDLQEESVESEKRKRAGVDDLTETYKKFVEVCATHATQRGLFLIGQQGGVIYDYQAEDGMSYRGPPRNDYGDYVLPREDDFYNTVYNVSYGIRKPQHEFSSPPLYPYGSTVLVSDPSRTFGSSYRNSLGNFPPPGPMAPLCDYHGLNGPDYAGDAHSCETYGSRSRFVSNTVQEYLESYIEKTTAECVQKEVFEGLNISFHFEDVSAKTLFSNEKVYVEMSMPVNITSESAYVESDLPPLTVEVDTRLKLIHELVDHLIKEDVNNIFFDIVGDANTLDSCRSWRGMSSGCLREGMEVSLIRNPCKNIDDIDCGDANYDNILVVEDKNTLVFGRPYTFYIAIENRYPALDLLYQTEGTMGFKWDYVFFVGDKIVIEPYGYDPDGDHHGPDGHMEKYYYYSMWKEDYDETYNHGYCSDNPQECRDDPLGVATIKNSEISPEAWTSSPEYQETGRKASYVTEESDRGGHLLRVSVCNEGGLCDYQILRIYVGDMFVDGSFNLYSEIPDNYASLEDPYTIVFPELDGLDEAHYYTFKIFDEDEDLVFEKVEERNYTNIPENAQPDPFAYRDKIGGIFSETGVYTLEFEARGSGDSLIIDGISDDLNVVECLPHRSSDDPYPFHDDEGDFLFSNRTCCVGDPLNPEEDNWGTYAGTDQVCYREMNYGCFDDFDYGIGPEVEGEPTDFDRSEDVYKSEYEVFCSGDEGMTCTGEEKETRTWVERCDGPCKSCAEGASSCDFEANQVMCDTEFKCSDYGNQGYGSGGNYSCKGGCYLGECEYAIDCECSIDCGSECDEGYYRWENNSCFYECGVHTGCEYGEHQNTICFSPSDSVVDFEAFTLIDEDGEEFDFFSAQGSSGNILELDGEEDSSIYGSVCVYDGHCHVSSCGRGGAFNITMDECLDPGESNDLVCYTGPGPSCDLVGNCTSKEVRDFENNPEGDVCYYNIECTPDGWEYEEDDGEPDSPEVVGDVCYFGDVSCDDTSGWVHEFSESRPDSPYEDDGTCYYGLSCTDDGWEYDYSDDFAPDCEDDEDSVCTDGGWDCE